VRDEKRMVGNSRRRHDSATGGAAQSGHSECHEPFWNSRHPKESNVTALF
jgi:hypothetical protein